MRKKLLIWLSIFLVIAIAIGGYRYKSNLEKKEMVGEAVVISQEYIRAHYGREFILKSYDVLPGWITSTIFIEGYIKDQEDAAISITYNYREKKVENVGGPAWFIDSEKPGLD